MGRLPGIAVAAAAEHAPQRALAMLAQRAQCLGQRVGRVCVVDHGHGLVAERRARPLPCVREAGRIRPARGPPRRAESPRDSRQAMTTKAFSALKRPSSRVRDAGLAEAAVELHRDAVHVQASLPPRAARARPAIPNRRRRSKRRSAARVRRSFCANSRPKASPTLTTMCLRSGASNRRALAAP